MQFDVVNSENKKVGSVDVSDDVFGGGVNADLIWESLGHAKAAAELLKRLGVDGNAVLIDTTLDEKLAKSVRNMAGVEFVASGKVDARSVMNANKVIATRGAIEKLA